MILFLRKTELWGGNMRGVIINFVFYTQRQSFVQDKFWVYVYIKRWSQGINVAFSIPEER